MSTILNDYILPRNFLKEQQTNNLRQGLGEELWKWLEEIEAEEDKKIPLGHDRTLHIDTGQTGEGWCGEAKRSLRT